MEFQIRILNFMGFLGFDWFCVCVVLNQWQHCVGCLNNLSLMSFYITLDANYI